MKSILLTSTALVAFAGAAAADVSLSGTAEFSYNSYDNAFSAKTTITGAGSMALDNGYTASASLTFCDGDNAEDCSDVTAGDITIANDSSSITYHIAGDGASASHLGDPLAKMDTGSVDSEVAANIFADEDNDETNMILSGSATIGGVTIGASTNDWGETGIGVASDLGGIAVSAGIWMDSDDSEENGFGALLSGSASNVDYSIAVLSDANGNTANAISASTTAGGADITLDAGNGGWEVGASMPLGGATVGFTYDDAAYWTASVETTMDAVDLGLTVDSNSEWDLTASYDAGDMTFDFATDEDSYWSVGATYDLGNGLTAGAGTDYASDSYAEINYDLGAGASAGVVWANFSDDDYDEGTTISVSFSF